MKTMKIKTVSTTGKHSTYKKAGVLYANMVNPANGQLFSQIAVEVEHSTGVGVFKTQHTRTEELINFTFENGEVWSGTMKSLQAKLNPKTESVSNTISDKEISRAVILRTAIGQAVGELLSVKFNKTDGRCKTSWGTKTVQGLGASIMRIVEEHTDRLTEEA